MASSRRTPFVLSILAPALLLFSTAAPAQTGADTVAERTARPATEPALGDRVAEAIRLEGIERSQAHAILRELTGQVGHRLTGSDNFTRACEWARARFADMGLEVEVEKWGEWQTVWNRGRWHGRVIAPVELDMYVATDAWTAGTGGLRTGAFVAAPADADAVVADEVAGKWVIGRRKPSSRVREAVEAAGALGVVYRANDPNQAYPTRVRVFGDSRVARGDIADVPTLPEIAVRADHFDTLMGLVDDGKNPVAEFEIQNWFREGPIALHNVIASIRGTELPDEVVIVSAHLDSWHQAQGCTDNGTGTASTIEAARILSTIGARPKRTIRFCLWGGEEQGLLGSRAYVQRHRTEMDKVSAVFNHDTGTNWAQSLGVTEAMHEQLEPVFAQVTRLLTPPDADFDGPVFDLRTVRRVSGGGGSDHASFIAARVPGLNWGLRGRSDYFQHTWHTQWDTFDVAIEEYQRHTSTVIAMAALGTANLDALLDREGVEPGGGRSGQSEAFAEAWFEAEMDGLEFEEVKDGGRAAKLGVKKGDVLTRQIFQFAREAEGDEIKFTVRRGDETFAASMKKGEMPQRRRRD